MRKKSKQAWVDRFNQFDIECRPTFAGIEIKINDKWEFIHSDQIYSAYLGASAYLHVIHARFFPKS